MDSAPLLLVLLLLALLSRRTPTEAQPKHLSPTFSVIDDGENVYFVDSKGKHRADYVERFHDELHASCFERGYVLSRKS